ncbi:MAG: anti-sigma factor [Pseudomonadota bacterium]
MNLLDHPDLADRIAAAYALGTLRGGARRRFESQARQSPALRASALVWQERFAAMTELQKSESPSINVWKRIDNQLAVERGAARIAGARDGAVAAPNRLRWWQGATWAGGMAAAAAFGIAFYLGDQVQERDGQLAQLAGVRNTLQQQNIKLASELQGKPEIQYVAVLSDDQAAPSMLVTFDPKHSTLTIKRVGQYNEGPEKSLQLWALPAGGQPRSLGVLGGTPVVRLATAQGQLQQTPALAVSLEPLGGVPGEGGPTGPVLWKGALLQTP